MKRPSFLAFATTQNSTERQIDLRDRRSSRSARPGFKAYGVWVLLAVCTVWFALYASACDVAAFAANSTIQVLKRASPSIQRYRDPDFAEEAIPGSIGTMEGVLEIQQGDATLRWMVARAYASYGYGFLENRLEQAEFDGAEEEVIEHWRFRSSAAYLRAREVAVGGLDQAYQGNGGIAGATGRGLEAFVEHISHFNDRENQVPLLFWLAYSWARWIGLNRDNVDALADLPYVSAIADRVIAIDETYFDYAPLALRAGLIGSAPEQYGGRPAEAKTMFDDLIQRTGRRNLMYLVTQARIAAVGTQDRALYESLLNEENEFDVDSVPESRLANTLAQRRARRYLQETDMLFAPADEEPAGDEETSEEE
jgi:hypothetical protein